MAEFKARMPPAFNPFTSDFTAFSDWQDEFNVYVSATDFFAATVNIPTQQARLFNLAGSDFMKYVKQLITVDATTTIKTILEAVGKGLKPTRFDLQNREKLFCCIQRAGVSAVKFVQEIRDLYSLTGYQEQVSKDLLIRDLFVSGIASTEAKRLLFQEEPDSLTIERCLNLVTSFESVHSNTVSASTEPEVSVSSLQKDVGLSGKTIPHISYQSANRQCNGCGQKPARHHRKACPAYKVICHSCGKVGHFSKVCRGLSTGSVDVKNLDSQTSSLQVAAVSSCSGGGQKRYISISINGRKVSALVDSGSDVTIINEDTAKRLQLSYSSPTQSLPRVVVADGSNLRLVGVIPDACLETSEGYLLDNVWVAANLSSAAILGQSSLSAFRALTINFGGKLPILTVNDVSSKEKSTFTTHPPVQCFSRLDHSLPATRASSRRHSCADKAFIQAETKRLWEEGKISSSNSSWRSQVFVVRELNRKPRMVIDYAQTVNRITPLDAFPIPLVSDLLDTVSKFNFFSYIDLKDAFHQFQLDASERYLTAFEADGRLWEFNCIPFGLRNSPAAFSRALQDLIGHLPGVIVYLDDVVIGGSTLAKHNKNLRAFLKVTSDANLTFSHDKCTFRGTTLRFLGHIVTNGTLSPDPQRSAPFRNFPTPTTVKQLERFIRLAVYHSKWVPKFSQIMHPLFSALTSKSLPLSSAALQAIIRVKKVIHQATLFVPDPNRPLLLTTDASNTAIAAILSQDGRPVAFLSRRLSPSQRRWSPAELEGFAVVQSCHQFRHYLANRPFTIRCDQHGFVQTLNSTSSKGVKNAKFARWKIELAEFDFTIQHISGILNTAADALSRSVTSISLDPSFQLVKSRHEQFGHPGVLRLSHLLRATGDTSLINNVDEVCHNVISNCRVCAEVKPQWINISSNQVITSTAPWQRLSIDFMTNKPPSCEGFSNLLTVVDEFSRYPFAFPTRDRSASTVVKCLEQLFILFGPPTSIHSDNGAEFRSDELKSFLASWGVHQSHTSPYNPAGNGQVERYNGIIWKTVQSLMADRQLSASSWPTVLGHAALHPLPCQQSN